MQDSIVVTKFNIPPPRAQLVQRPGLIRRLNAGLDRKLTLVSAPAGFGKTTLVSEWVDGLRSAETITDHPLSFAWLSLDIDDNDPIRFLTYFASALNQIDSKRAIGEGALSMLQSPQPPPLNAILVSLINDLAAFPEKIVFVVDDYHLMEAEPIHRAVQYLLENLPQSLHLVIVTRQDPYLPISRLRASNQLSELRAADMRFSRSEAAEFLNTVMGLNLSEKDVARLEARTEGWIAGLQLAALSIQGRSDAASRIKAFTGSNRLVLDYLMEEVLEGQPERIEQFLLRTSILDRLTGPLCDAITGQADGQETLEELDQANLFIVPLDDERRWYRYHHLFADLLRQRLFSRGEDFVNELHARAFAWYEAHDDLTEAVHHALAGRDSDSAVRLIERGAPAALGNSDFRFILDSVELLPEAALKQAPWLFIFHAWALLLTGQVEAARPKLKDLDWLLECANGLDEPMQSEMLGNIAGLRVISASWLRDYQHMTQYADQVRRYLPENDWICGYCAMMLGGLFWGNGNLGAAKEAFAESAASGKASGNPMMEVSGICNLAHTLTLENQLQQASELYEDAFKRSALHGTNLPVSGYIHVEFGNLLYETNELEQAEQHLKKGIKLCRLMADGRAEKIGYFTLAKVQLAKGELADVQESIRLGKLAVPDPQVVYDMRGAEFPQVRLWLKENDFAALKAWLDENDHRALHGGHFKTTLTFTMHARALIALAREYPQGPYLEEAWDLLEELFYLAESNGWTSKVIEILCLQSLAYDVGESDGDQAMATLERAIKKAQPESSIRTFVDEGPAMGHLLYEALKRGIAPGYVRQLLAAFPVTSSKDAELAEQQAPDVGLIEPLSGREIEVLELLAHGLTNRVIADRLVLSLHTVKAHTRNIYAKLDVHNRTQAVDRAMSLGILSAP